MHDAASTDTAPDDSKWIRTVTTPGASGALSVWNGRSAAKGFGSEVGPVSWWCRSGSHAQGQCFYYSTIGLQVHINSPFYILVYLHCSERWNMVMLFLIVHRFHITIIKTANEMNLTSSGWTCVKMPLLIPVAFSAWFVSSLTLLLHRLHPSAQAVKVVETMPSTRYSAAAPQALRLLPRQLDYR